MSRKTFQVLMAESRSRAYAMPNTGDWQDRHFKAWSAIHGPSVAIRNLTDVIGRYADYHAARYESPIGEDNILGPAWLQLIKSARTLLNGECGNLDCGTVDNLLVSMALNEGFSESDL